LNSSLDQYKVINESVRNVKWSMLRHNHVRLINKMAAETHKDRKVLFWRKKKVLKMFCFSFISFERIV